MQRFITHVSGKYKVEPTYEAVHAWSCESLSEFWTEVWDFAEIKCSSGYERVIGEQMEMNGPTKWFEGALLNYAENMLERGGDDDISIIEFGKPYIITL